MPSLKQEIKLKAKSLGFHMVGIAKAAKTEEAEERLLNWLHEDFHASMGWMENRKEERGNILQYFPEAKSVISVGFNYYNKGKLSQPYKVSRYAWGDDYHDIVKKKLFQLLAHIQSIQPSVKGIVCTDTSPVMEKVWAQRAGLGWMGKHTNLITREYGSWVFLGELILDIDLTPDPSFEDDLCGTCTACLDVCPTNALVDGQLNAEKCISFWTIEHKKELPEDMKHQFKDWIYGCDICQDVCPWNHKSQQQTDEVLFYPREPFTNWSKDDWDAMNEEDFRKLFKGSAIKRTKFSGLKRNIQFVNPDTGKQINEQY